MNYKIKETADIAGISIRTLHHYDQFGLVKPESSSPSGYRLYSDRDIEKLQQVLFFKELGFSLKETKEIINDKSFDKNKALKNHKELLLKKKKRLEEIIYSIDKTIEYIEGDKEIGKIEMFKAFNMDEIKKHQEKYFKETKQKYGESNAYAECEKKTAQYSEYKWKEVMEKASGIFQRIAECMEKSPADEEVQIAVGQWKQHITESFYNCTLETFRSLGDLYVTDRRFTKNIDKIKPGLACFLKDAIHIYCSNQIYSKI